MKVMCMDCLCYYNVDIGHNCSLDSEHSEES